MQSVQEIPISIDTMNCLKRIYGNNKISILKGHYCYHIGIVILHCHIDQWVIISNIEDIQLKNFSQITEGEWRSDGYDSQNQMINQFRKYYPDTTLKSPATLIWWKDSGKFWIQRKNIRKFIRTNIF